jgi:acetyl esterase
MPPDRSGPTPAQTQRSESAPPAAGSASADARTRAPAPSDAPRTEISRAAPAGPNQPDPQMQQVLNELQALGAKPVHSMSVDAARRAPTPADAVKEVLKKQGKSTAPVPVARVIGGAINGPGGPIPARIYWPQGATPGGPALPVVLYIHGGGWVIADLDTYDATPRALANAANAIVVSTHYRQAPEHKFPAAHDDTWTAYQWVVTNATRIGGDPKRIAVAGESAGGNMAAAIALRARDEKALQPVHQLLVYPVADAALTSPSENAFRDAAPLSSPDLPWFFTKYLGNETDAHHRYFAIRDADLAGVAPATIITAQIDPLRSEGEDLARRLQAAGVPVRMRNFEGVTHEFFGMGAVLDKAREAVEFGVAGLRSSWQQAAAASAR